MSSRGQRSVLWCVVTANGALKERRKRLDNLNPITFINVKVCVDGCLLFFHVQTTEPIVTNFGTEGDRWKSRITLLG